MAPFFTVFTLHNKSAAGIINRLTKLYAPPLVDGLSYYPQNFHDKYGKMNGKYFRFEADQLLMFDGDSIGLLQPEFVLTFDHGVKVTAKDWKLVVQYLDALFFDVLTDDLKTRFEELVPKPVKIEPDAIPEPKAVESPYTDKDDYEFEYIVDKEGDLAICQVDKPYTDRPYTVVIRNYTARGLEPLFTGLYVSQSWGVANYDYGFLVKLWDFLDMEKDYGPLNLEQRLKDDIAKCNANPLLEPEVYRETLEEVREKLEKARKRKHLLQ